MAILLTTLLLVFAATTYADSRLDDAVAPLPRSSAVNVLPHPDMGEWVGRAQLVWDAKTRKLARRHLRAWRNFPGTPLDFLWLPDTAGVPEDGRIAGNGRLVWREPNASTADRDAVVSVYRGTLVDGKAQGSGSYVHRSGFAYEGEWAAGLMHGEGRLRSPFGSEFVGTFDRGRPVGGGHVIDAFGEIFSDRLDTPADAAWRSTPHSPRAETGGRAPKMTLAQYAQHDSVRIGVFIAPRVPAEPWMSRIEYTGAHSNGALVVTPADNALNLAWLGSREGDLGIMHAPSVGDIAWSATRWDEPVELRLAVRNDSTKNLRIANARLQVKRSIPVLNPLVDAYLGAGQVCMGDLTEITGRVTDVGWASIEDSAFRIQAGVKPDPARPVGEFQVGAVNGQSDYLDITGAFAQIGLDRDYRRSLQVCDTKSLGLTAERADNIEFEAYEKLKPRAVPAIAQCFEHLRDSGALGDLGTHTHVGDGQILVDIVATYVYQWTDHAGKRHQSSRVFPSQLSIGTLMPVPGCGGAEGGEPEPFFGNKLTLRSDGEGYQVPVPLRNQTVKPGSERSWSVLVAAPKSSWHEFTFVLDAGGKRLSSQPVRLTFFRPNRERLWDNPDAKDAFRDQQWIQLASRQSAQEATASACEFSKRLDNVAVYRAMNDWHAIVSGPFPKNEVAARAKSLMGRRAIPADSVVTDGSRFIEPIRDYPCP